MHKISALALVFLITHVVAAYPTKAKWKFGAGIELDIITSSFVNVPIKCELKRICVIYFGYYFCRMQKVCTQWTLYSIKETAAKMIWLNKKREKWSNLFFHFSPNSCKTRNTSVFLSPFTNKNLLQFQKQFKNIIIVLPLNKIIMKKLSETSAVL